MNSILESLKERQASNNRLESEVNSLKSRLFESNTSLRKLVVDKSKIDQDLEAQILGRRIIDSVMLA